MNNFSWSKAIGFGVLIWAIMTAALWILTSISSINPLWAHGIVAGVGVVSAFLFAQYTKPKDATQALQYGAIWVITMLILDLAITQWFDSHIFAAWQYWIGSALVLLSPLVQAEARQTLTHSHQI